MGSGSEGLESLKGYFEQAPDCTLQLVVTQYTDCPYHNLTVQHTDYDDAANHLAFAPHNSPPLNDHIHDPLFNDHTLRYPHVPTPPTFHPHYWYVDTNLTIKSFAI